MDSLRRIIREELKAVLKERVQNNVYEAKERQPRPGVGKAKSKKGGARFTSAGTIPPEKGRTLSRTQIQNREEIGKKMLNMFRRGGVEAKNFRNKIQGQLDSKGLPSDKKHQYSQIWATASGMAAKGATAADFPRKPKQKSKPKKSTD